MAVIHVTKAAIKNFIEWGYGVEFTVPLNDVCKE